MGSEFTSAPSDSPVTGLGDTRLSVEAETCSGVLSPSCAGAASASAAPSSDVTGAPGATSDPPMAAATPAVTEVNKSEESSSINISL